MDAIFNADLEGTVSVKIQAQTFNKYFPFKKIENMFGRKQKKQLRLVRLFLVEGPKPIDIIPWEDALALLFDFLDLEPTSRPHSYEVNLGEFETKSRSKFLSKVFVGDKCRLYDFLCYNQDDYPRFWINSEGGFNHGWPHNLLEISFVIEPDGAQGDQLVERLKVLRGLFPFEYGYTLDMNWDSSFILENESKKTFWGTSTITPVLNNIILCIKASITSN